MSATPSEEANAKTCPTCCQAAQAATPASKKKPGSGQPGEVSVLDSVVILHRAPVSALRDHDAPIHAVRFRYTKSAGRRAAEFILSYSYLKYKGIINLSSHLAAPMKTALNKMNNKEFTEATRYLIWARDCFVVKAEARVEITLDLQPILEYSEYGLSYLYTLAEIIEENKRYASPEELTHAYQLKAWSKPLYDVAKKLPQDSLMDLDGGVNYARNYLPLTFTLSQEEPMSYRDPVVYVMNKMMSVALYTPSELMWAIPMQMAKEDAKKKPTKEPKNLQEKSVCAPDVEEVAF